ncbi:INCEA protein, partial [Calyptomena viridis]|nr:INCEA protein [Calyptomena viridis]
IKDFIKRNTPTRPYLKVSHEKERQRLESLRKKEEAEEQRKKKVEEEKRRRQAEMKKKREERLRKALQARERVEQMEEEKKKRVEQKILQNDEKTCLSQVREEKMAEERSKRKVSRKQGDVDTRKQKALRGVRAAQLPCAWVFLSLLQEENEQQELLQKRREDEVKGKGKKVLELKNLIEQQQVEQAKERCELVPVLEWGIGQWHGGTVNVNLVLELGCGAAWRVGVREQEAVRMALLAIPPSSSVHLGQPGSPAPWKGCFPCSSQLSPWFQKSLSASCLGPSKDVQGSGSHSVDENNYGLDLKSDDSTDDENDPRKPVPAWADGVQLHQAILHQYYHPVDVDELFGAIPPPQLQHIFYKSKPRYFKRTSSAVWHSPP